MIRSILLAVTALLALASCTQPATPADTQTTPVAPVSTYHPGDDTAGEAWWTTTDCPAGVQIPCLDPTVEGEQGLPVEVAAQVEQLVEAQWGCIAQVGEPMPDGTVRVTNVQLQQCREHAYAAAA